MPFRPKHGEAAEELDDLARRRLQQAGVAQRIERDARLCIHADESIEQVPAAPDLVRFAIGPGKRGLLLEHV